MSNLQTKEKSRLTVHPELKSLIPPLTESEYDTLETSILREGIRDPLVVWDGVIIDGHNRYQIAREYGLSFETIEKKFDSLEEAKVWMIDNQKGRRNLTDGWKWELAQTKRKLLQEKGKENQAHGKTAPGKTLLSNNDKSDNHNTRKEISKELGWSTGKVAQAEQVWDKADPEVKDKVKKGELTIGGAYKEVKRETKKRERDEKIKQQAEQIKKQPLPERNYSIILADPPWRYEHVKTDNRKIENHYPTMSLDDICDLDVPANDNCLLYLWATAPKLEEALRVLNEWGFTYRTCAVWDKGKIGMGYWFRGQHELLLVGVKGDMSPPETENRVSSVFSINRGEHSEKPKYVYEIIENAFPDHSKVELFARNKREGWDSWGNQL